MAKQFVSYERLLLYDNLIKSYIELYLLSSNANVDNLLKNTNFLKYVKDQILAEIEFTGDPNKIDTLKDVLDYFEQHGSTIEEVVKTYSALEDKIGEDSVEATEETEAKEATGIYKRIDDSMAKAIEDSKNIPFNAEGGEEVKVTLSGTIANPSLDVTCIFCTENDIAKLFSIISVKTYDEISEALNNAVPGDTVKLRLTEPITLTGTQSMTIPSGVEVKLNLNGQNITSDTKKYAITNNGILTISDDALTGSSGKIVSTNGYGISAGSGSTTTILSGTIEAQEAAVATPSTTTGATINIVGGSFKTNDNGVVMGNGTNRTGDPNVINISGGKFEGNIQSKGYIACGVYAPWRDIINITGGEFTVTNGCGVLARAGQVNIEGGSFTTNGDGEGWVGDNKNLIPCAAVVFDSRANYPGMDDDSKITISGGTFNPEVFKAIDDEKRIVDLRQKI